MEKTLSQVHETQMKPPSGLENWPGIICFWDFSDEAPFTSKGQNAYELLPSRQQIGFENEGPLLGRSVKLLEGDYLYIPRKDCGELSLCGVDAAVTVCAWIKRERKSYNQCEAIAGMWNETLRKRQYCLFLNISLFGNGDQVCGHISGLGGPTPGNEWCIDVSIGRTKVAYAEWRFVAFTYDGTHIRSYLDGEFDGHGIHNPYLYTHGIYDGGKDGADFTVGAVNRLGEMGNNFVGLIKGLAVFNRALSDKEIKEIFRQSEGKAILSA